MTSFNNKKAIRIAVYASHGLSNAQIARKVAIGEATLERWMKKHPLCSRAIAYGRKFMAEQRKGTNDLRNFILGRLTPKQRKTYEAIEFWSHSRKGPQKIDALLKNSSVLFRQSMWLHAYLCNGFNASRASMMIGISKRVLQEWKQDPEFHELCEEVIARRNDFYESRLVDLVALGSESATIFVNRTVNRDRGYGEKIEIEHSGEVDMSFSLDQLELPVDVMKQVYEAMMKLREPKNVTPEAKALPPPEEIDKDGVIDITTDNKSKANTEDEDDDN